MVYYAKAILTKILIVFLGLGGAFTSDDVQNELAGKHVDPQIEISMAVSNLVDSESQEALIKTFEKNGISTDNVKLFIDYVDQFNSVAKEAIDMSQGFKNMTKLPIYDEYSIAEKWDAKYPEFIGNNCRLTVFDLFHDNIKVSKINTEPNSFLIFDNDVLQYRPDGMYSREKLDKFNTFFGAVPAALTKDVAVHVKEVKDYYKRYGIEFADVDASIINVWFHDDLDNALFVGHTGILMPLDEGYMFVEKLAFQLPYQAVRFDSKRALCDYLMQTYDISYNQPTAKPFVMENDHLLEGYKLSK